MTRHSDQYKALVLDYSIFAKFFFLAISAFFYSVIAAFERTLSGTSCLH